MVRSYLRSVLNLNPREKIPNVFLRPRSNTCAREDWQSSPSSHAPAAHIDLLPKTFPLGQTSVSPSPCPVQSQPPKGTVCSPTELQHPRTRTSANSASPQITSLCIPPLQGLQTCLALKIANPDREIDLFALLNPVISFYYYYFFYKAASTFLIFGD